MDQSGVRKITQSNPSGGSILVACFIQPRESFFSSLNLMKCEIRENGVADIHLKRATTSLQS